jgi:hypothetical protein
MSDLYLSDQSFVTLPGRHGVAVNVASGQLVIVGDFNQFMLDEADRALVKALIDAVEMHRACKKAPTTPTMSIEEADRILTEYRVKGTGTDQEIQAAREVKRNSSFRREKPGNGPIFHSQRAGASNEEPAAQEPEVK